MKITHNSLRMTNFNGAPDNRLKVALVYQAGIANVFLVECFNLSPFGRNALRVYQGAFSCAENFAKGCGCCGAIVHTFACNMAGDIAEQRWSSDLEEQPFSDKFCPVFFTVGV